jgi:nucleotide sugar dehydrogenase
MPGYCDAKAPLAERWGYALSYSPGFVAQGSIMRDQQRPDQILIGEADPAAGDRLECVYRRMCGSEPAVHRMPRLSAEIAKLATNAFLTMKIAFANAIGDLATRAGADPARVLDAVGADGRIGRRSLSYGFGYGGPCFPRDNRALNLFARQHECDLLQAEATDEMNRRHLAFQAGEYLRAAGHGDPIHFASLTYKPGTDMLDESQPLALAVRLARAGRRVVIHERPAVVAQVRAQFGDLFEYEDDAESQWA